ncbi:hypothetical protein N7509_000460, partial [Penicillium cosmopolitanum]
IVPLCNFDTIQTWRKQYNIQSFYDDIVVDYYEESRKMYPQWIGRRDKNGCAIYIFPMRHLTIKRLDAHFKKISVSTHIVDVSGVSIRQFLGIRKYLQEASATATAHYPETLGRVFVRPPTTEIYVNGLTSSLDQNSDAESTLNSLINPLDLPKAYDDGPARELMVKMPWDQDTVEGQVFPKGPIIFGKGCIRLLGTIDGKPRCDN